MNENLEVLTALLVGGLVAILSVVFTGSADSIGVVMGSTFALVLLVSNSNNNKEDN